MTPARTPWRVILGWLGPRDRAAILIAAVVSGLVAGLTAAPLVVVPLFALLAASCAAITLVDYRHYLIPDLLSLPLLPLGFAASAGMGQPLWPRAVAVVLLWILLRAFATLAYRVKGVDAFGQGDVKLIAVAGAWLSFEALAPYILVSAIAALGLQVFRRHFAGLPQNHRIPFGSTLAPVLVVMALLGPGHWP